jgi:CRP-like cAMP-binding protein
MVLHIYKEPIRRIPFLRSRESTFYLNYITKLIPSSFASNTVVLRAGTYPEKVYFIYSGQVENTTTRRTYTTGGFFGERDIIRNNVVRKEGFLALSNSYLLSFKRQDFLEILRVFPDIKAFVESVVNKRDNH